MMTSSPLKGPVKIVASTTLLINFFTASRVPLQSFGWLIFHNMIIGTPIFYCSTCGGLLGRPSEFKTSVGELTASSASTTVSMDLYVTASV